MSEPASTAVAVRDARAADMAAVQAIYAHHVRHGLATFEEVPPSVDDLIDPAPGAPTWAPVSATGEIVRRMASRWRPLASFSVVSHASTRASALTAMTGIVELTQRSAS